MDSIMKKSDLPGLVAIDGTEEIAEIPNRVPKDKKQNYSGGGGLFSSPEDYSKLLSYLLNDGIHGNVSILEKETIDQLFEKQLEGISLDITDNYFQPNLCCDFRGLIKPSSNWSLIGLIDTEITSYGRKKDTVLWGGAFNTYWYIDRESGVSACIFTQYFPFNHFSTTSVFNRFSELIYENYH